ncbi:hypothetical protein I3842_01G173900 [Carya illinoinensis]|uniref:Uncharacterized protein n=1 Tax=Carya illinoinensis TaxID=32201 RepID=A0A922G1K6_CARIL|nr:hypothetical protein I3842_01G173900 [Carya illinoinensis]
MGLPKICGFVRFGLVGTFWHRGWCSDVLVVVDGGWAKYEAYARLAARQPFPWLHSKFVYRSG